MKVNTDSFFAIGKTHRINQDYVLTNDREKGEIKGDPFAIVCDGCSTAPNTDFGARLLALSAKNGIKNGKNPLGIITTAEVYCRTLGLPPASLSATLLMAYLNYNQALNPEFKPVMRVTIIGDGVVAVKYKDGRLTIKEIKFPSNAPYYLKYELNATDRIEYYGKFGTKSEIKSITFDKGGKEVECKTLESDIAIDPAYHMDFVLEDVVFIALMSDGAGSFQKIVRSATSVFPKSVETVEAVKRLTNFKNYHGEFVQRNVKRALEDMTKEEWQHMDDLSVAAISVLP